MSNILDWQGSRSALLAIGVSSALLVALRSQVVDALATAGERIDFVFRSASYSDWRAARLAELADVDALAAEIDGGGATPTTGSIRSIRATIAARVAAAARANPTHALSRSAQAALSLATPAVAKGRPDLEAVEAGAIDAIARADALSAYLTP